MHADLLTLCLFKDLHDYSSQTESSPVTSVIATHIEDSNFFVNTQIQRKLVIHRNILKVVIHAYNSKL